MKQSILILCLFQSIFGIPQGVHETMTVILRDNRFHVLDKDGFPVRNLSQEDFTFSFGKKALKLSHFEEVDLIESQETATNQQFSNESKEARKQNIVIVLDSGNMDQLAFNHIVDGLEEFLTHSLNPNSRVKLVQLEEVMLHFTEFTANTTELTRKLREMKYRGKFRAELRRLDSEISQKFDDFIRERDTEVPGMDAPVVKQTNSSLYANMVDDVITEKELAKYRHFLTFMYNMDILGEIMEPMTGDKSIYLFTGGQYLERKGTQRNTFKLASEMAKRLNNKGITVYSFLHQGKHAIGSGNWKTGRVSFMDPSDAMMEIKRFSNSTTMSEMEIRSLGSANGLVENQEQMKTGPSLAANQTGGLFRNTVGNKNLFQDISDFLSHTQHYYRFTYTLDQEDQKKKLEIKIKDRKQSKKYDLYFGKNFTPNKPFSDWNEVDRLVAFEQTIRFTHTFKNELDWEIGCNPFWLESNHMAIPVYGGLKIKTMPKKGFEIGFAAFDANHLLLDVVYETVIPQDSNTIPLFYHVLLTQDEPAFIRFFLRNLDNGELGFQELPIHYAPFQNKSPMLTGLTLGHDLNYKLLPIHHIPSSAEGKAPHKRRSRVEKDPYHVKGKFYKPAINCVFQAKEIVPFYFHMLGATLNLNQYQVGFSIIKEDKVFPIPGALLDMQEISPGNYKLVGKLQLPDLLPGTYQFRLEMFPPDAAQSIEIRQDTFFSIK